MPEELLFAVVAPPLVAGLVQAAKQAGLRDRLAPLISILLGGGAGVVWDAGGIQDLGTPAAAVVWGIVAGLTASGFYSAVRSGATTVRELDPRE